jgi:hypothetical protein
VLPQLGIRGLGVGERPPDRKLRTFSGARAAAGGAACHPSPAWPRSAGIEMALLENLIGEARDSGQSWRQMLRLAARFARAAAPPTSA